MRLCNYGCGQEAKYQFKNGKWCCSKSYRSCPETIRKITKEGNPFYGKNHTEITKTILKENAKNRKHTEDTKKKISISLSGENNPNYGKTWKDSEETKRKKSIANKGNSPWNKNKTFEMIYGEAEAQKRKDNIRNKNKGRTPPNKNKPHKKISILKMSISSKLSIEKIKDKFPTFFKMEEMRYNPDKPGKKEIQVHCKNHNCPNSKEQGGWFTPTYQQIQCRKNQLEKDDGNDGSYFYCSGHCKQMCYLYNLRSDPFKDINSVYTQKEKSVWKHQVLEQDDYTCQICGSKDKLDCHHIIPVKVEPMFALDPDNGIVLCEVCHYKYGHKDECSTGNLSKKICI